MEKLGCWLGILTSSAASNSNIPRAWQAHTLCVKHRPSPRPPSSKTSGREQPGDIHCDSAPCNSLQAHWVSRCWGGPMLTRIKHLSWRAGVKSNTCTCGVLCLRAATTNRKNLAAENNRSSFSHSSTSQNSKIKSSTGSHSLQSL